MLFIIWWRSGGVINSRPGQERWPRSSFLEMSPFFAFHYVIESKFYSVSTNGVQHRPTKRTTLFTTQCVPLVFSNGNWWGAYKKVSIFDDTYAYTKFLPKNVYGAKDTIYEESQWYLSAIYWKHTCMVDPNVPQIFYLFAFPYIQYSTFYIQKGNKKAGVLVLLWLT